MMKFAPAKEQYQQFLNQFAGQFCGRVHVVRWRAQPDFGNPRFTTCSTASQNLSNSSRWQMT